MRLVLYYIENLTSRKMKSIVTLIKIESDATSLILY